MKGNQPLAIGLSIHRCAKHRFPRHSPLGRMPRRGYEHEAKSTRPHVSVRIFRLSWSVQTILIR
jgi:hypothetical protein